VELPAAQQGLGRRGGGGGGSQVAKDLG
jgi:hypothetical protein